MPRRDHSRLEALANRDFLTEEAIEQKEELLRQGFTIIDEPTPFDEPEKKPQTEDQRAPTPEPIRQREASSTPPARPPLHVPEELSIWITAGEVYNELVPTIRERARLIEPLEEAKEFQEITLAEIVDKRMPSTPEEPEPIGDRISVNLMKSTVYYLLAYAFKKEREKAREKKGGNA